jgi:16S rRNA (cytosine967-C5)-methyltransferase
VIGGGARGVAARVLARVQTGAYASATLDGELRRAGLDRRDAALASQIVYGALRVVPRLDAALAPHVHRGIDKLDPFVRAVLWAAAYQILFLERVPVHATVDAAVEAARDERGAKVGGFVNRGHAACRARREPAARAAGVARTAAHAIARRRARGRAP